jgi:hypothetical protein
MTAKKSISKPDYKEDALWNRYNKDEALISQLIILREYLDNEKSIRGHAVCMLDGLVDKLICDQVDMISEAKLPY